MAESVNVRIADEMISHETKLLRFSESEYRKVLPTLQQMEKSIISELANIDPTGPKRSRYRQARLESLLLQVREILRDGYSQIYREQRSSLGQLAAVEQATVAGIVNAEIGVEMFRPTLTAQYLRTIADDLVLTAGSSSADSVKGWWSQQAGAFERRYATTLREGMFRDESLSQLIKRVRDLGVPTRRGAQALVRTSVLGVHNEVNWQNMLGNTDVVVGVAAITTLDTRTCLTRRTEIATPQGLRRIDALTEGDYVYGGSGEPRRIKTTLRSQSNNLCKVELSNRKQITCTIDHQFLTTMGWVEAESLLKYPRLLTSTINDSEIIDVLSIQILKPSEPVYVYDIELDGEDCFIAEGVTVHNSFLCISRTGAAWNIETGEPLPGSTRQEPFPGRTPWHWA